MSTNYHTYAEIDFENQVSNLGDLSDYDLANVYLYGVHTLGSDHPATVIWLKEQIDYERRVRASGGRMERGIVCVPYRWHINDTLHMAICANLLRDAKELSEPARAWYRSVHHVCWITIAAKAKKAAVNDRLLTVRETCDVLGVSRDGLWKLVKDGKIKEPMKLAPRTFRFHPCDVTACLAGL